MDQPDRDKFKAASGLLVFLESIWDDIWRISKAVQDNPEFFNAVVGRSTIKAAADKLEELVKQ